MLESQEINEAKEAVLKAARDLIAHSTYEGFDPGTSRMNMLAAREGVWPTTVMRDILALATAVVRLEALLPDGRKTSPQ